MKIANRDARKCVEKQEDFVGSSLFAVHWHGLYVVYSYGVHWPLFICKGGKWYENVTTISASTTRHANLARPRGVDITPIDSIGKMLKMVDDASRAWEKSIMVEQQ